MVPGRTIQAKTEDSLLVTRIWSICHRKESTLGLDDLLLKHIDCHGHVCCLLYTSWKSRTTGVNGTEEAESGLAKAALGPPQPSTISTSLVQLVLPRSAQHPKAPTPSIHSDLSCSQHRPCSSVLMSHRSIARHSRGYIHGNSTLSRGEGV